MTIHIYFLVFIMIQTENTGNMYTKCKKNLNKMASLSKNQYLV